MWLSWSRVIPGGVKKKRARSDRASKGRRNPSSSRPTASLKWGPILLVLLCAVVVAGIGFALRPRFTKPVSTERYVPRPQGILTFNKDIAPNINFKWRYVMYANYETLALKTLDHRLEANISAKVTKFINVSIGSILVYDYDQDLGAQFSQAFSLGLLYSIQNFEEKK